MQLPFTVIVELPARAELHRLFRTWRTRVIVAGIVATVATTLLIFHGRVSRHSEAASATLKVTSSPTGASIEIDGRIQGHTPINLGLEPGEHRVRLRHEGYADATYRVNLAIGETSSLHGELWLRTPEVRRLRPVFPGATIAAVSFLRDGRVALVVALPPGEERQLWLVDERGGMHRVGPLEARGSLTIDYDGKRIAYLARGHDSDATTTRLDEVWIAEPNAERGERHYELPDRAANERLVDLSWVPDGEHLLIVSRQQISGGGNRSRLVWLDLASGDARELAIIPSDIVPGSYSWSPRGDRVALLTRSGQVTSLCVVGTNDTDFRYLADLSRDAPNPLAFPPLAWSPDGERLLYAAPTQDRPSQIGWLFGSKTPMALFTAEFARPLAQRISNLEGQSPTWWSDGSIVTLARPKASGPLIVRLVDPRGEHRDLVEIPLAEGSAYAARWDVAHARAIVAVRGSATFGGSRPEYWLVQFRPAVEG